MSKTVKFIGEIVTPPIRQRIPQKAAEICTGKVFRLFQWEEAKFDGRIEIFEKVICLDSVSVLPVTDNNQLIIGEQEQPGRDCFLGLLGGRCEPDEPPQSAAVRELEEEAGIIPGVIRFLGAFRPYEKIQWCRYYFTAHELTLSEKTVPDQGERIRLHYLSTEEFCELIKYDKLEDMYFKNLVLTKLIEGGVEMVKRALNLSASK